MAKKSLMSKIADVVLGPDKGPTRPHPAVVDGMLWCQPPGPKMRNVKKAKALKKIGKSRRRKKTKLR
jgi:hypothetical protein